MWHGLGGCDIASVGVSMNSVRVGWPQCVWCGRHGLSGCPLMSVGVAWHDNASQLVCLWPQCILTAVGVSRL